MVAYDFEELRNLDYPELNLLIQEIKNVKEIKLFLDYVDTQDVLYHPIVLEDTLNDPPLNVSWTDAFISYVERNENGVLGIYLKDEHKIDQSASPEQKYTRDLELMHEFAHVVLRRNRNEFFDSLYSYRVFCNKISGGKDFRGDYKYRWLEETVVNWLAFRWRASPKILNEVVSASKLPTFTYDLPSSQAFHPDLNLRQLFFKDTGRQLILPFGIEEEIYSRGILLHNPF